MFGLAAAVCGVIGGIYALAHYAGPLFGEKSLSDWNVVVVVDRSATMAEPFDGGTKWDAVARALHDALEPGAPGDNLALRSFGGPCLAENTTLAVDFGHGNKGSVRSSLGEMSLDGKTSLADAVVAAIGDFNDPERFGGRNTSIIVITGGEEFCAISPPRTIADRLGQQLPSDLPIQLDLRFVGVGLHGQHRASLGEVAARTGGRAYFANTAEELALIVGDRVEAAVADRAWDFADPVGPEWSAQRTEMSPQGARMFLGQFGNEAVTLSLGDLPAHTELTISFDLFVLDSWDGNHTGYGPDVWSLTVDGEEAIRTTFANVEHTRQAYPGDVGADHPARTGAREEDTLGYNYYGNTVYRIVRTVSHTGPTATITFEGSNLQGVLDESWGLGFVTVDLAHPPEEDE